MLLTHEVEINITVRNARYYEDKGYEIPKVYSKRTKSMIVQNGAKVMVKVEDIAPTSKAKLQYECDCCHNVFTTNIGDWNRREHLDKGVYCKDCAVKVLLPQCLQDKYGVTNSSLIPSAIEKKKQTNLERYGAEWAIASDCVKEKIGATIEQKYGVSNPMQNENIKDKTRLTNIKKYGGTSPMCDKDVLEKARHTNLRKYGVPVSSQCKEVQAKARQTLYKNGTTPSSKAENTMCNILRDMFGTDNCDPNYPEGNLSLDCLVRLGEYRIDFEYDGIYWHKDRQEKDRARNAVLINLGYRVVRIKGNNIDAMPTHEQIQSAVDYLIKENHHLTFIDMNK